MKDATIYLGLRIVLARPADEATLLKSQGRDLLADQPNRQGYEVQEPDAAKTIWVSHESFHARYRPISEAESRLLTLAGIQKYVDETAQEAPAPKDSGTKKKNRWL